MGGDGRVTLAIGRDNDALTDGQRDPTALALAAGLLGGPLSGGCCVSPRMRMRPAKLMTCRPSVGQEFRGTGKPDPGVVDQAVQARGTGVLGHGVGRSSNVVGGGDVEG